MDFRLTGEPIDPEALLATLGDTRAGAFVTFEGRIRIENQGRTVRELEYEVYGALAEKEGSRIVAEARERFGLVCAACVHRRGRLALGETAVWVAALSVHREKAFEGCRYIIDEVKARVPIWKKEHYEDGSTEWIACAKRGPEGPPPP
jgi:molybdopterin synthase catalytic subunit